MPFKYGVLLLFALGEVLLFDAEPRLQLIVSIIEYVFLTWTLHTNLKVGVMYLISFSLLSMGAWSYVFERDVAPGNFWGVRVFGFSANILFTLGVAAVCLLSHRRRALLPPGLLGRFVTAFILYSAIIGAALTLSAENWSDNYLADILVFLPYFAYLVILSVVDTTSLVTVARYGISLTVVTMLVSFGTGRIFFYGINSSFVLMNGFAYVVVFLLVFMRRMYSPPHFIFLLASMALLIASNLVFFGGKAIVCTLTAVLWASLHSRRAIWVPTLLSMVLLFVGGDVLQFIADNLPQDSIVAYKFEQVLSLFRGTRLEELSTDRTSMGNLAAELTTIAGHMFEHPQYLLFGKGFGGGVPDLYGNLAPMAQAGAGYSEESAVRNYFVRMHLPVFEVAIKTGIAGFVAYMALLVRYFRTRNLFALGAFIMLATVFTNTKETILLTAMFISLAEALGNGVGTAPSASANLRAVPPDIRALVAGTAR